MTKGLSRKWYAIYTRSRHEKRLAEELSEKGIENYLPMQKVLRQWSDRRKFIRVPLFTSYVFVHVDKSEFIHVLDCGGAVCFIKFAGEYAPIPDWQINNLKIIIGSEKKFDITCEQFEVGQEVEVTGGSFKGLKGTLIEHRGKQRVLVKINTINQNLLVNINPLYLKKNQIIKEKLSTNNAN